MGMNKLNEAKLYLENDKWLSSFAAGLLRVTWLCLYQAHLAFSFVIPLEIQMKEFIIFYRVI